MNNNSDKIILALIQIALGNADSSQIPDNVNWREVLKAASIQGVLGICFDAVGKLPESVLPERELMIKWFSKVHSYEKMFQKYKNVLESLNDFYTKHGIRMVLLKGYGLSLYWPVPSHRQCGDIDIFLVEKDSLKSAWQTADKLVSDELGIHVEEDEEHHTVFQYKGITVENHYDFINVRAHSDAREIEKKLKELSVSTHSLSDTCSIAIPSENFNAIFLIRHLGQHFAGEKITLRQLLDFGLFLKNEKDKIDWNEISQFLKKIHIWRFFCCICNICEKMFGFTNLIPSSISENINADSRLSERIIADILHPEFNEKKPKSLIPVLIFKTRRWWNNRWKHKVVYHENLVPMFFILLWSKLRRFKSIKY